MDGRSEVRGGTVGRGLDGGVEGGEKTKNKKNLKMKEGPIEEEHATKKKPVLTRARRDETKKKEATGKKKKKRRRFKGGG